MKFRTTIFHRLWLFAVVSGTVVSRICSVQAGTPADPGSPTTTIGQDTRYGLFGWLDHRSQYGAGVFPEPFLVDDSDLEEGEVRFDWLFTRNPDHLSSHLVTAEMEKGFGLLTLEVEVPFEIDRSPGGSDQGFNNIDLGARYPIFQYVSPSGFADTTFGIAVEVGVPVHTVFSKRTEIVPKLFNDTKIGNFTLQSVLGCSMLRGGGGEDAGLDTFEYGFTLGYAIQQPVRGVEQFIPVFELSGETGLNNGDAGHNSLLGNIGFRLNLSAIGSIQPRLGFGYVFPLDQGGREDLRHGLYTSLVFEF